MISTRPAHPALVSEDDFVAVQAITAVAVPEDGSIRRYLLVGLLRCGSCGRSLHSHWVHDRPGYRCRHGHTSAHPPANRAQNHYPREDHILARIKAQLHDFLAHHHVAHPPVSREPHALADFLHANAITVICGPGTCTLTVGSTDGATAIPHPRQRPAAETPTEPAQQR